MRNSAAIALIFSTGMAFPARRKKKLTAGFSKATDHIPAMHELMQSSGGSKWRFRARPRTRQLPA